MGLFPAAAGQSSRPGDNKAPLLAAGAMGRSSRDRGQTRTGGGAGPPLMPGVPAARRGPEFMDAPAIGQGWRRAMVGARSLRQRAAAGRSARRAEAIAPELPPVRAGRPGPAGGCAAAGAGRPGRAGRDAGLTGAQPGRAGSHSRTWPAIADLPMILRLLGVRASWFLSPSPPPRGSGKVFRRYRGPVVII